MKSRWVSAIAVVSLMALPLQPVMAKPAANEVELHIEATAEIPPDRALVPVMLVGNGKDQAAADADLAAKEKQFRAGLAKLGIDPAKVTEVKDDAVAVAAMDTSDCVEVAAAAASAAADMPAPAPKKTRGKKRAAAPSVESDRAVVIPEGCEDKMAAATKMFTVELDDLTKLEAVSMLGGQRSGYGYGYGRGMVMYTQSDPAAAHQKGREGALAKARGQADGYAAAMGYKIVRVVRVSNARPVVSTYDIFDVIGMFAKMDNPNKFQPTWFSGTVYESVAVDYVMVPK